jgi:ATP-binding cassette subfamily F protein 3
MREALAEALSDNDGAIVMVSHDRHLIGLVCDSFVRVAGGKVEAFDGDLDAYAAWLRSRPGAESGKANKPAPQPKAPAPAAVAPAPKPRGNPHKLAKAEQRVAELEARQRDIEAALASPEAYADGGARATELGREQARVQAALQSAEAELLALYDAA